MTGRAFAPLALAALLAGVPLAWGEELLPEKTDIPGDFSTVLCPDRGAAMRMLHAHYGVREGRFDIPAFMRGLEATQCQQRSGPLVIERVIERRRMPDETVLFYLARRPDGSTVYGLVSEEGNNRHPRNAFEAFLAEHAPAGKLRTRAKRTGTYVCATAEDARAVVAAIPPMREVGLANPHQVKGFQQAIKRYRCIADQGSLTVTALHERKVISRGNEWAEEWTALSATNARGEKVGVVFDADLIND